MVAGLVGKESKVKTVLAMSEIWQMALETSESRRKFEAASPHATVAENLVLVASSQKSEPSLGGSLKLVTTVKACSEFSPRMKSNGEGRSKTNLED